jgi:inner membrane protein
MGRAGFNRKTAYATLTMLLAAEAADCDVLWEVKGPIAALQHHRGITHSFVGVPLMAAATLLGVYVLHRVWLGRRESLSRQLPIRTGILLLLVWLLSLGRPRPGDPPIRWGLLYWLAVIAALSHLLLDYTTAYGIRLFEPFNHRWYSWDIMFIIDPIMLAVLALGLVMPSLFGLVNQEIGARSRGPRGASGAIFALACIVVVWGYRDFQHRRALNAMSAVTYNGATATRIAAYPSIIDPFRWLGVVETADFLQTLPVNSARPEVDPRGEARTYYKPEETPVTLAAKQSYFGRVYLDWAVFPFVESQTLEGDYKGYVVEFRDLRYAYPGRSVLGGFVLLSPNLQVEEQGPNSDRPDWLKKMQGANK